MQSHQYNFEPRQLLKWLAAPCLVPIVFFAAIRLFAALHLLPPPFPILDMDRTILIHQALAAKRQPADLILIGDSSCLVDVAARSLQQTLPDTKVLNLGTLSYLDLDGFALLLKNHSPAPKYVLLLMHPEALRLGSPNPYYSDILQNFLAAQDACDQNTPQFLCAIGADTTRARLLSRVIPVPLPGTNGQFYGFNTTLWRHLNINQGSAIDPHQFNPKTAEGNAEYRLSQHVLESSKRFRAALPAQTKLFIGITPCPQSFVLPNHKSRVNSMLQQWSVTLQPATPLRLPETFPDQLFASPTHLNADGQRLYSLMVAQLLAQSN
jgi:hypothetical protein